MSRKEYEEYKYVDLNNLYVYPGTNILRNKLNIQNEEELSQAEYQRTTDKLFSLYLEPIWVHSMTDICSIHEYMFSDLYDWAGEYRQVNISKEEKAFLPMQAFNTGTTYMNQLLSNYHQKIGSYKEVVQKLAEILDYLNYMHPFREGNGRTQREVIRVLALSKGYKANINLEDDEVYHLYMDGTVSEEVKLLEELFEKVLTRTD